MKRTPIDKEATSWGTRIVAVVLAALALIFGVIVFTNPELVYARSSDLATVTGKYPSIVGSRLESCSLCHTSSVPALNAYGTAFKSNGRNSAALSAIENQDSDGDGFSNIVEIMALTFPGNAADKPVSPSPTATKPPATATHLPPTATPVQPTATNIPPTATQVQPTATNIPPTATQVQPTATGVPPTQVPSTPTATIGQPTQTTIAPTATPTKTGEPGPCKPPKDKDKDKIHGKYKAYGGKGKNCKPTP